MKKVLIISNSTFIVYLFRLELVERLLKNKNEVWVLSPWDDRVKDLKNIGCQHVNINIDRHGTNPLKELKLYFDLKKSIKEINPDIVLTYTIKPNVYGGAACASLNVPYIANVTGLGTAIENGGLMQKITLLLYRYGLRNARTVFFQNTANKELFTERKLLKSKIRQLPGSGVNTEQHKYEAYPQFSKYNDKFLFVGRIMKDKGIGELLEAAKKIKKLYPNVTFDIVGGFDEDYSEEILSLENMKIIKYWGQQLDVHEFYKNCSAVVLPSYHEGMANVLLEASSTGRPVLASNVAGCRETFDEGVTGFGFEPKDTDSLVNALKRFIELDYEKKVDMGKSAREKVKREFDRQIVVEAYMKELENINQDNNLI